VQCGVRPSIGIHPVVEAEMVREDVVVVVDVSFM
jgi:hypothetical protein